MNIKAIVYTSNTGYTKEYAELLSKKTGLPVYSLNDAVKKLDNGAEIIYLGWLMAGSVKGYKTATKQFKVLAVCGVGMGATGSQLQDVKKANGLSDSLPVFTLQGGFDIQKLHGIYKFMMTVMRKTAGKALQNKADRTAEEDEMLSLMLNGGSRVSEANLSEVLGWYMQK